MEKITEYLGKAGIALALMGVASIILSVFNYNLRLLAWVDLWGDTMGWVIRIGLIVIGGTLFFVYGRGVEDEKIKKISK